MREGQCLPRQGDGRVLIGVDVRAEIVPAFPSTPARVLATSTIFSGSDWLYGSCFRTLFERSVSDVLRGQGASFPELKRQGRGGSYTGGVFCFVSIRIKALGASASGVNFGICACLRSRPNLAPIAS